MQPCPRTDSKLRSDRAISRRSRPFSQSTPTWHGHPRSTRSRDGETVLDAAQSGGNAELIDWLTGLLAG